MRAAHSSGPGWRAAVLGVFFALAPAAAAGGGLALAVMQMLAAIAAGRWTKAGAALARHPIALVSLLGFAGWTAASALWSPVDAAYQASKVAGCFIFGLAFVGVTAGGDDRARGWIRAAGVACVLVLLVLSLVEAAFDMPLNRLAQPGAETGFLERNPGKGVSVLVVLIWPALAALLARGWGQRALGAAMLIGTAAVSPFFSINANAICFAASALVALLALAAPRVVLTGLAWGFAAWLLAAPFVLARIFVGESLVDTLPLSWRMRVQIWEYAAARVIERPVMGWGLDASGTFNEVVRLEDLFHPAIPLHPHSFSLQVWLETGAVGAVLLAIALLFGGWAIGRALASQRLAAAGAAGAAVTIGAMWNLSFGAWQEWWIATAFAAAALTAAALRPKVQTP